MKTTLYIQNLKCAGCESTIINKLSELKNIYNITIKLQYATVTFEHETKEDITTVKNTLSKIGYPPFGEKNTLAKKAKSFASCASGKIKK
ncbi:heavy-metal-associated domain-containing protein [Flavivirga rizhaonensis]|uniref:Heavy-metal-associated domain-containing protein n=1 Tax=Flavivirga rizhaonensis TaxID=2559571 RepID=A0A4V3P585_9FLAO|nr:heavy metal-associated domain-containing protein [Flavivirga rizhaonensis]TGV04364.1 heavy-metal-associated domain-containing protein [Flavivirga rizhaonensis]